jgi:hypothetical protein
MTSRLIPQNVSPKESDVKQHVVGLQNCFATTAFPKEVGEGSHSPPAPSQQVSTSGCASSSNVQNTSGARVSNITHQLVLRLGGVSWLLVLLARKIDSRPMN